MDFTMAILTHPIQALLVTMLVAHMVRRIVSGASRAAAGERAAAKDAGRIPATFPLRVVTTILCLHASMGIVVARAEEPPMVDTLDTVTVRVVVDADGSARDPQIVEGTEPFASAALDAVRNRKYEPARDGERAISSTREIRVRFQSPPSTFERWRSYRRASEWRTR